MDYETVHAYMKHTPSINTYQELTETTSLIESFSRLSLEFKLHKSRVFVHLLNSLSLPLRPVSGT